MEEKIQSELDSYFNFPIKVIYQNIREYLITGDLNINKESISFSILYKWDAHFTDTVNIKEIIISVNNIILTNFIKKEK